MFLRHRSLDVKEEMGSHCRESGEATTDLISVFKELNVQRMECKRGNVTWGDFPTSSLADSQVFKTQGQVRIKRE